MKRQIHSPNPILKKISQMQMLTLKFQAGGSHILLMGQFEPTLNHVFLDRSRGRGTFLNVEASMSRMQSTYVPGM